VVAQLPLQVHVFKKNGCTGSEVKERHARVIAAEENEILIRVVESELPLQRALVQLGLAKSTYYPG